ncbi:MAG TPA: N-acetylglucosamine-6-phosphate deacetylase [Pyrinomonadaceae bacterium]|nr:N-acetylglucosamine-6-phosphate deacetylase [Pyrinomonadaceae bacterium]
MTAKKRYLVEGAKLVLPDRVVDGWLRIDSSRISSIGFEQPSLESEDEVLDAGDLTIYPGFIDVHIHGADGIDTMEASAEELSRASVWLAAQGVTGWMPTLVPGPVEEYQRAVAAIEEAHSISEGARVLGVHYEGPFVNAAQCGALRSQFFRTYAVVDNIDDLPVLRRFSGKHLMTVAPEVTGGIELIAELTRRGWIVSIGHTRADFDVLDQARSVGARHMTHFMNAMAPLHHRSPGPVGWGLLNDVVTCDVIADGIHLDPRTLQILMKIKGAQRLVLISDAIAAAGLGDGVYHIWNESITVKGGRTSNQHGSIAGSVISMLDAVRLMSSLGVAEVDLARISSTNPARLLEIENECGSIEEGKRADLVALDDAGQVRFTMIGGEVVYS